MLYLEDLFVRAEYRGEEIYGAAGIGYNMLLLTFLLHRFGSGHSVDARMCKGIVLLLLMSLYAIPKHIDLCKTSFTANSHASSLLGCRGKGVFSHAVASS